MAMVNADRVTTMVRKTRKLLPQFKEHPFNSSAFLIKVGKNVCAL